MKTITSLLTLFAILISSSSYSQKSYFPKSTIEKVVVYEKGAMITRTLDVSQIDDAGIIIIDSLPKQVNPKSLQVNSGDGLKIISVKFEKETVDSDLPPNYEENIAILSNLNDSIQYYYVLKSSINHEINVIIDNDDFETEQGVDIDQISKASQLYKSRLRELKLEELDLTFKIRNINQQIDSINNNIQELSTPAYQNNKAVIKIDKPASSDRSMTISYFTPNATWYTFYDLRISEDKENAIDHKAYVSQNTGEAWENVKLTLSNRNPNKRIALPSITPYQLQNNRHNAYQQNTQQRPNNRIVQGIVNGFVFDTSGEPLIGANVIVMGTNTGVVTNIDGSFSLNTMNQPVITVSYTGYETQEIDIRGYSSINITLNEGQLLDEVVVTGYSGSSYSKSKKVKREVRKSISIKEQQSLNVNSFEIERLYTIPSDSEEYDVLLKSSNIPFEFKYLIYPSLEPVAYLNVGIPDWKSYNLFSGNVNLFLGGQYTGVSNIDIGEKKDTLWFSLGEDIGINVERAPVKEYNKRSFFKNKTTELHTFDIEIKNNKSKSVTTTIMDQVPISNDDDIEVKVLEISNAQYDKDKGYLTWKDQLQSGGKRKYRISYEIKYGKNVKIVNR